MYKFDLNTIWNTPVSNTNPIYKTDAVRRMVSPHLLGCHTYILNDAGDVHSTVSESNQVYLETRDIQTLFTPYTEFVSNAPNIKFEFPTINMTSYTLEDTKHSLKNIIESRIKGIDMYLNPNTYTFLDVVVPLNRKATIKSKLKIIAEAMPDDCAEIKIPEIITGFKTTFYTSNPENYTQVQQYFPVRLFKHTSSNVFIRISTCYASNSRLSFFLLLPVLFPELKQYFSQTAFNTLGNTYTKVNQLISEYPNRPLRVIYHMSELENIAQEYIQNIIKDPNFTECIISKVQEEFVASQRNRIQTNIDYLNNDIQEMFNSLNTKILLKNKQISILESVTGNFTNSPVATLIKDLVLSKTVTDFNIDYQSHRVSSANDNDCEPVLCVTIVTPMNNYEPDLAEIFLRRQLQDAENELTAKIIKALQAVFVEQKAALISSHSLKAYLTSGILRKQEGSLPDETYPNPHLYHYSCFGNTHQHFTQIINEMNYQAIVPTLTNCVANLNFADSVVARTFITDMKSMRHRKLFKDYETNEMLTILEVYNKYVEKKED